MKLAEAEIERIVREVIAKLAGAPSQDGTNGQAATATKTSITQATLQLDQPLITLADLKGSLQNHDSVTIRSGAVVTPAVRDFLRERNVRLVRGGAAKQAVGGHVRLIVGVMETSFDASGLLQPLSAQGIEVERSKAGGLPAVMESMLEQVTRGKSLGLVLTGQAAAAVCLANRRPGVRAALASRVADVEAAIGQIGVNLLVINPQGQSGYALRQMVSRFCTGAPHACPEALKMRLQ